MSSENKVRSPDNWIWWWIGVWLLFGLGLEGLHGLKISAYLAHPVRRLMWTLAHAHGLLLSFLYLFVTTHLDQPNRAFVAGVILMPLGFLLGGIAPTETDPFVGVYLAPIGALLLLAGYGSLLRPRRRGKERGSRKKGK